MTVVPMGETTPVIADLRYAATSCDDTVIGQGKLSPSYRLCILRLIPQSMENPLHDVYNMERLINELQFAIHMIMQLQ